MHEKWESSGKRKKKKDVEQSPLNNCISVAL